MFLPSVQYLYCCDVSGRIILPILSPFIPRHVAGHARSPGTPLAQHVSAARYSSFFLYVQLQLCHTARARAQVYRLCPAQSSSTRPYLYVPDHTQSRIILLTGLRVVPS